MKRLILDFMTLSIVSLFTVSASVHAEKTPSESVSQRLEAQLNQMTEINSDVTVLTALLNQLWTVSGDARPGAKYVSDVGSFRLGSHQELTLRTDKIRANAKNLAIKDPATQVSVQAIMDTLVDHDGSGYADYWQSRREAHQAKIGRAYDSLMKLRSSYDTGVKSAMTSIEFLISNLTPDQITDELQARLTALQAEIATAEAALSSTQTSISTARSELSGVQTDVANAKGEAERVRSETLAAAQQVREEVTKMQSQLRGIEDRIEVLTRVGQSGAIEVNIATPTDETQWYAQYQTPLSVGLKPIVEGFIIDLLRDVKDQMPTNYQANVNFSLVYESIARSKRWGMLWTKGFKSQARVTVELTYQHQRRFVRTEIPVNSNGDVKKSMVNAIRKVLQTEVEANILEMAKDHCTDALAANPA